MPDARVFDKSFRAEVLTEIRGDENKLRKREAWRRYEVYRDRQDEFVELKLKKEFGEKSVSEIRKITSINLTKRICNKQASIYSIQPKRTWTEATDEEIKLIEAHYKCSKINVKLKKANKYYKLMDQCAMYVVPKFGEICAKVLTPHQYDVVPSEEDPERGSIYILNTFDKSDFEINYDDKNQKIADTEDYKKTLQRFVWWTDEVNFITDGHGEVMAPPIDSPNAVVGGLANGMLKNPIGLLPFIDIAWEKDFEYWCRMGKNKVDFNIDFSTILSDWATVSKLQGYAQAVVVSEEPPNNMLVGPTRVVHLKVTSTTTVEPKFQFVAPAPDLASTLDGIKMLLSLFLTAEGLDPKTISGTTEGEKFSSGIERLLSMLDQFEATRDDFDLFEWVEEQKFILFKEWNNNLQGTDFFREELVGPRFGDKMKESILFAKPEVVQTRSEQEDSVIKRLDKGLITFIEAIMELRGVTEDEAKDISENIEGEKDVRLKNIQERMSASGIGVGGEQSVDISQFDKEDFSSIIFHLSEQGVSTAQIAKQLNANGTKTPGGGTWTGQTVANVLRKRKGDDGQDESDTEG